jgi:hypothetical protein
MITAHFLLAFSLDPFFGSEGRTGVQESQRWFCNRWCFEEKVLLVQFRPIRNLDNWGILVSIPPESVSL